jgi:hypothetical protein
MMEEREEGKRKKKGRNNGRTLRLPACPQLLP